ncbi:PREDICTED: selenoprotein O-like [Amphimedon queenslandica]|uniref:Selenoprotein O n=1 Tax=Amphimedon queenslandica TaxID=400682 RepID=A0A1X7VKB8_AMPQE|nr:PREDICTED: selenoprotein O-like [Amphimedon queenslandica]XP_019864468.1 PREDICTED: selenoprotein O-like [Amphimedon queenslandica]|eukprot:XP_019864467.1 PREDICTED: selenoprotein O-like [Amphimedon queenslandica]
MFCAKRAIKFSCILTSSTVAGVLAGRRLCLEPSRSLMSLESLQFDNRVLKSLPVDEEKENYVRSVSGACYSLVNPTPVKNPQLVSASADALNLLGLDIKEIQRPEFIEYFSGNKVIPGSEPAAHCYCGHQFGHFSGQLGDGCALYLGEVINSNGERWELQLKGSGKTPYSRHADGRKVLRSSIREFLCSEAMHYLGIPTTRAGSCITSESLVARDIFYNGNVIQEQATVISRIAPTFIRFGSFEIFKTRDATTGRIGPSVGRDDIFHLLLDYVTEHFYPEIYKSHLDDIEARTAGFFNEICRLTGRLVAMWQCVGFCHGVLNTDNMSIVGVTIDYGPFGFLDRYDPAHICNKSDDGGRYAFSKQPSVCKWNLRKLSEALSPCLSTEKADEGLELYEMEFQQTYLSKIREKLGLVNKAFPEDSDLVEQFLDTLHETGCDFTNGFRKLNKVVLSHLNDPGHLEMVCDSLLDECATPDELVKSFKPIMPIHQLMMFASLGEQSPMILMSLGLSPEMIKNELTKINNMEKVKKTTVEEKRKTDRETWLTWLALYRSRLGREYTDDMEIDKLQEKRVEVMNNANPRFVLRNHIAQSAISLAEDGDFSEVNKVLQLLQKPYDDESAPAVDEAASSLNIEMSKYFCRPPDTALSLSVT